MKIRGLKGWLAVAGLALFAGLALADYNVRDHSTHHQNASTGLKTNSTGDLTIEDSSPNRDVWRLYPNIINNQLTASGTGMVDSSQAQSTADMRRLVLVLYGTHDSVSTIVSLAVQIRGHYLTSSDSASAHPWIRWPNRSITLHNDVDSVGHGVVGTYALAQATSANVLVASNGLWPGEFKVKFNVAHGDTAADGHGKYGGFPKGMWIPLNDYQGQPFWAPYTSVRVRVINGVRSRFRIRAELVGSAN